MRYLYPASPEDFDNLSRVANRIVLVVLEELYLGYEPAVADYLGALVTARLHARLIADRRVCVSTPN